MEYTEVKYIDGKKFEARNRKHTVIIDLPEESGGNDQGPTPPEIFIDSLGSCIGVYVLGFCKGAGLDAKGMKITLGWEKSADKPSRIKSISAKIELPNAEVGARRPALLKVAESCLIHETIKHQPEIAIELI
ncbi:MAG: OsmC family protein [Candidatus Omnitrophota bacterium]|jgi:ribosomal protein S12 methylthiotransferase accessory factor